MYALVFGLFYAVGLNWFVRQSMQAPQMGGGPMNINQMMIRYVFMNSTVIILFVVPLITMRTYAEEKRSGTIELLMTSPITDFQIILGKFLGAMALYAAMLGVTLIHMALLFVYGNPEWKPIADRLPRAAAARRLLRVGRAVLLEPDEEPDRRRHVHLRRAAAALGDRLDRRASPGRRSSRSSSYLSITDHLEDFLRGVDRHASTWSTT